MVYAIWFESVPPYKLTFPCSNAFGKSLWDTPTEALDFGMEVLRLIQTKHHANGRLTLRNGYGVVLLEHEQIEDALRFKTNGTLYDPFELTQQGELKQSASD